MDLSGPVPRMSCMRRRAFLAAAAAPLVAAAIPPSLVAARVGGGVVALVTADLESHAAAVAFTLYARPDGTAFVHALDTRRGTAMCIDLPWPETGNGIWGVRLPVAGGMLRLRHEGTGTLATIDLASHRVYAFRRPPAT